MFLFAQFGVYKEKMCIGNGQLKWFFLRAEQAPQNSASLLFFLWNLDIMPNK